jgi:putative Ca2+/H+ antiporter (TMEM165/GDT1 family)
VLVGERLAQKIPLRVMRYAAAASFAVFGVLVLLDVDLGLGFGG